MSQLPAIIDTEAFERIEDVAKLFGQGVTSPHTIARRLNIKVIEVKQAIEQWHTLLREDTDSHDAARDALNVMLQRYDTLLQEANDNLAELQQMPFNEKISAQIIATLKLIGDLDKTRVDLLQKAGLLDNSELGDELAEREEREAQVLSILRNDLCENCKHVVRDKLSAIMRSPQPSADVVDGEVVG
jgi:hypothetical protein